jgi:multicomponent Na+:H+ antiporter subunit G
MMALQIVSITIISVGLLFLLVSTVGLLRLPDAYTRTHAVATSETIGLALIILGLLFHPALDLPGGLRLAFILAFSLIANPTAVHALMRAARRTGLEAWKRPRHRGDDPGGAP